ncbi:hypothetical protein IHE45_02G085000 [Dioscorea alata]|uniref:Uncharacterized protein n=1 Tax=Dioscorea alata TaxID=55571 RepID=A0ACB7WRR0_DIOAL|nr:hypothetical protein IHE45_02G085000 [Dioscorea alata]
MHSLCPAIWSKHRWLLMSMICLNPLALVEDASIE